MNGRRSYVLAEAWASSGDARLGFAQAQNASERSFLPPSRAGDKLQSPLEGGFHGKSSERGALQRKSAAGSIRANNVDPDAFYAAVFRTEELCGHNCVDSVFSGTLGFDPENSASRLSLVVGDNSERWSAQSSNGEPLGTRAAASED